MKRQWLADMIFVEEEQRRIEAYKTQGEQYIMVQSDVKAHGFKTGLWPSANYRDIIDSHAEARGWDQAGFSGMEIIQ